MLERFAMFSAYLSVGVRYLVLLLQVALLCAVATILLQVGWHLARAFVPLMRALFSLLS